MKYSGSNVARRKKGHTSKLTAIRCAEEFCEHSAGAAVWQTKKQKRGRGKIEFTCVILHFRDLDFMKLFCVSLVNKRCFSSNFIPQNSLCHTPRCQAGGSSNFYEYFVLFFTLIGLKQKTKLTKVFHSFFLLVL